MTTEGTLSGFQEFFLQPIIKDRPKNDADVNFFLYEPNTTSYICWLKAITLKISQCLEINSINFGEINSVVKELKSNPLSIVQANPSHLRTYVAIGLFSSPHEHAKIFFLIISIFKEGTLGPVLKFILFSAADTHLVTPYFKTFSRNPDRYLLATCMLHS